MTNIIFPVTENFEENAKYVKSLKISANILVGVTEEGKEAFKFRKAGMKVKVFKSGSKKEEMINSLQQLLEEGATIILRKQLSHDELLKFLTSKTDITVCDQKKRNKFCEFFFNIWKKIIRLLFDFSFFDGDVSAVGFSEEISKVILNISNLSYASRVNRWKGVTVGYVKTSSPPAKKEYSRARNNIMLIGFVALFLGVIASIVVYYLFCPVTFLSVLLWICAVLITGLGLLISVAIYILTIKTGKRYFSKAEEV